MSLEFFTGLHQPSDAKRFAAACISIHRLFGHRVRSRPLKCGRVMVDSGAFTILAKLGRYPDPPETYAGQLHDLHTRGVAEIVVAATQDYMCEPFMLQKTGLTVADHQRLTIERFDAISAELRRLFAGDPPFPLMPVLQGFAPEEYVEHLRAYGDRIAPGAWVGVGSVCKRQGSPKLVAAVLQAIKAVRPDLRLHGFGVKLTALQDPTVRELLATADSLAWSYSARRQGRSANDWREAEAFAARVGEVCAVTVT